MQKKRSASLKNVKLAGLSNRAYRTVASSEVHRVRRRLGVPRIFLASLSITVVLVAFKYWLHQIDFEVIAQTSLHNGVISSVVFVLGFILSATIADYKESEKIPAEFASTIQDIYDDASATHKSYPKFDLKKLHASLVGIAKSFRSGTRSNRTELRAEIADLHEIFAQMEKAGVPPNFVVKLKQQQAQLLKNMFRVNYIQKIQFIPSAYFFARTMIVIVIGLLLLTNIDPFYGGLAITGAIAFMLIYMILLIKKISVPFQAKGETQDDVSLFLLRETIDYLNKNKPA